MNWLKSIEEAIDYIESHLQDDFSIEDVASHVYMSSGYFQKAFSMLCGFTVSEYIRKTYKRAMRHPQLKDHPLDAILYNQLLLQYFLTNSLLPPPVSIF